MECHGWDYMYAQREGGGGGNGGDGGDGRGGPSNLLIPQALLRVVYFGFRV